MSTSHQIKAREDPTEEILSKKDSHGYVGNIHHCLFIMERYTILTCHVNESPHFLFSFLPSTVETLALGGLSVPLLPILSKE